MADSEPSKGKDIALVHAPTEDGVGAKVLRLRDGELSAGEVRPVREGQAIHDRELVRLTPMSGGPLCEVEVVHDGRQAGPERKRDASGPARVSNDAFRRNWNSVFAKGKGRRKKSGRDLSLN